jgi:hypothetical protein
LQDTNASLPSLPDLGVSVAYLSDARFCGLALPQTMAARPKLFGSGMAIRLKSLRSRFKELKTFSIIFIFFLHLQQIDINIVGAQANILSSSLKLSILDITCTNA